MRRLAFSRAEHGSDRAALTALAKQQVFYQLNGMSRTDRFCAGRSGSLSAKRATDDLLRLLNDGGEMLGVFQALGVEFVDVLRARRTCGKPAAGRDNLQAPDRGVISGSACEFRCDRFASEFCSGDVFRREFLEQVLLLGRGRGVDAGVIRRAELGG